MCKRLVFQSKLHMKSHMARKFSLYQGRLEWLWCLEGTIKHKSDQEYWAWSQGYTFCTMISFQSKSHSCRHIFRIRLIAKAHLQSSHLDNELYTYFHGKSERGAHLEVAFCNLCNYWVAQSRFGKDLRTYYRLRLNDSRKTRKRIRWHKCFQRGRGSLSSHRSKRYKCCHSFQRKSCTYHRMVYIRNPSWRCLLGSWHCTCLCRGWGNRLSTDYILCRSLDYQDCT